MPRQPFLKLFGKNKKPPSWVFGPICYDERSELTSIIGQCLMLWPDVELQVAILLGVLMKAETEVALAVFLKLRRSVPRREALEAAAKTTLDKKDFELFQAIMLLLNQVEGSRNDLAHGYFGVSDEIPDGILWCEQQHYANCWTKIYNKNDPANSISSGDEHQIELQNHIFIYKKKDLLDIERQIGELSGLLSAFTTYLRSGPVLETLLGPVTREELYYQLSRQDRIQESLQIRRARAQKTNPSKPSQK